MKYFLAIILLLISFLNASSQEAIYRLQNNPVIQDYIKFKKSANSNNDLKSNKILELPFFDDFSDSYIYPDTNRWEDNFAFINNDYALNPLSIGVATLDAIDDRGRVYPRDLQIGDYLTSCSVNLENLDDQGVFFSFFYQPQGKGDAPESKDSLVLEFYSPVDKQWTWRWSAPGDSVRDFKVVNIPVREKKYLQKGFKFRFFNYISLLNNPQLADMVTNCDHWNLDYIYMDKNRNASDTVMRDIAFISGFQSALQDYETVPNEHFKILNANDKLKKTLTVYYRNNDVIARNIDTLNFEFIDIKGKGGSLQKSAGTKYLAANKTDFTEIPLEYSFLLSKKDSSQFEIKSKINAGDKFKANNSISFYQKFYNYYSYDNGTAEMGYGMRGQNASGGKCAVKFFPYKPDTLRGVQIFFAQTLDNASKKTFFITVWNSKNGQPGDILFSQQSSNSGVTPVYESTMDMIHIFKFDTTIFVTDTFYIGWIQPRNESIQVGLDIERNAKDKIYYNIYGYWENTKFNGALMVRPIFGKVIPSNITSGIPLERKPKSQMAVYPNPANNQINVDLPQIQPGQKNSISIYDSTGKLIFSTEINDPRIIIRTSDYSQGLYFIKLTTEKGLNSSKKFIISR